MPNLFFKVEHFISCWYLHVFFDRSVFCVSPSILNYCGYSHSQFTAAGVQLKISAIAALLKKQSFPVSVNDRFCANLDAKLASLKAFPNMKGNGNPLITVLHCKVLKNEGRPPPLPSPGNCIPDVWESVKCRWFISPTVIRSLRNSNGKPHKKVSRDSGTIIYCGITGQKDIYCVVFLRPWSIESSGMKGKKIWVKTGERLSVQGETFLLFSKSLAEEDQGCRESIRPKYFEISKVNKKKSWNALRSWKAHLKF